MPSPSDPLDQESGKRQVMTENVSPILAPDLSAMAEHLVALFGRAMEGRIEITAIKAADKSERVGPRTKFFDLEEIDEAAAWALAQNTDPMWNVYVGAALRKPGVFPGQAADDSDFLRTYVVWADADSEEQVTQAKAAYQAANLPPAMVVVTGRVPYRRAQLWWPLETPIDSLETVRATVRGIADALGTDHAVCTGKQLMRLAGSLAWPKPNKPGRVLERTEIAMPDGARKEVTLEAVHRAFPANIVASGSGSIPDVEIAHVGALGLEERVMDGREGYAFRLVRATLRELIGTHGIEYSADELYREIAPTYFRKVDQVRPGRGPEFLKQKCIEAVRAYHAGQIPGMATLEEAVQGWATRKREGEPEPEAAEPEDEDDVEQDAGDEPFCATELTGEPPARRWIVPEWIPEGVVSSLYGDGGLGKTLLMQQLASAAAVGARWLGLDVPKCRVLAVLCEDERDELHRRQNDIKAAMGFSLGNPFDNLFLWPRLGRDNTLIRWNRDSEPALTPFAEKLVARLERYEPDILILDTLADFYGGNEIDRVQVNHFVKTVLGGMIEGRKRVGKTLSVILLGHPSVAGKATGSGYSGSTAWNAAVRARMYLSRPEDGASDERILTRGKANYAKSGDETAIRLFYADGVLHACQDAEDGDSILWAAMRDAVSMVDRAWRSGAPYNERKGHARFVHMALAAELQRCGFSPQISRQAIREIIAESKISPGKSNGKSGYRSVEGGK